MPIFDINSVRPYIVITGGKEPDIPDLNLQSDDVDKVYKLKCLVKLKSVTSYLENNVNPRHQYVLEIQKLNKFKVEEALRPKGI